MVRSPLIRIIKAWRSKANQEFNSVSTEATLTTNLQLFVVKEIQVLHGGMGRGLKIQTVITHYLTLKSYITILLCTVQ